MENREETEGRAATARSENAAPVYVMMHAPGIGYAGRLGDEVSVIDRNEHGVYVIFDSGIREFFPPVQFAALFRCL